MVLRLTRCISGLAHTRLGFLSSKVLGLCPVARASPAPLPALGGLSPSLRFKQLKTGVEDQLLASATVPGEKHGPVPDFAFPRLASSSGAFSSSRTLWEEAKTQQLERWFALLATAKIESSTFTTAAASTYPQENCKHVVASFAPSTMQKYFQIWDAWSVFAFENHTSPYQPPAAALADFLHLHSEGALGSALRWRKGLVWVAKYAGFDRLRRVLQDPVVHAYTKVTSIVERRERSFSHNFRFIFGESDSVRTPSSYSVPAVWWPSIVHLGKPPVGRCPMSLTKLHADALLGVFSRTKTTSRSMPFGVYTGGVDRTDQSNWATIWMNAVQPTLVNTRCKWRGMMRPNLSSCLQGRRLAALR